MPDSAVKKRTAKKTDNTSKSVAANIAKGEKAANAAGSKHAAGSCANTAVAPEEEEEAAAAAGGEIGGDDGAALGENDAGATAAVGSPGKTTSEEAGGLGEMELQREASGYGVDPSEELPAQASRQGLSEGDDDEEEEADDDAKRQRGEAATMDSVAVVGTEQPMLGNSPLAAGFTTGSKEGGEEVQGGEEGEDVAEVAAANDGVKRQRGEALTMDIHVSERLVDTEPSSLSAPLPAVGVEGGEAAQGGGEGGGGAEEAVTAGSTPNAAASAPGVSQVFTEPDLAADSQPGGGEVRRPASTEVAPKAAAMAAGGGGGTQTPATDRDEAAKVRSRWADMSMPPRVANGAQLQAGSGPMPRLLPRREHQSATAGTNGKDKAAALADRGGGRDVADLPKTRAEMISELPSLGQAWSRLNSASLC